MALIGRIRKHSGLLVIIIGVALAAFVLGDFLSNRSPRRGRGANLVGEVNGDKILYTDFSNRVDQNIENQRLNSGKENLTQQEQFQIRQQTWEQFLSETLLQQQVEKTGVTVTTEELDDLVRGKNPHPYIRQSFSDPETGQFDPAAVLNFLQNLDKVDPQMKQRYLSIEKAIKEDRLNTKFRNLVAKAYYIPKAFAERDYNNRNTTATVRFYSLPYTTVADSLIALTDTDYEKYYNDYKYRYQQEASRDIDYVSFEIVPSAEDRDRLNKQFNDLYNEFQTVENVKDFVNTTSDERYDSTWYKKGTLPYQMDSLMFNSPIGTTFGPYVENNMYQMARLVDIQTRPDSLRASHILISYRGLNINPKTTLTKEQAKAKADSILNVVKSNPAKFEEIAASSVNDDKTTAKKSGDLDWFADGAMVGPFNQAVLDGKVGEIKVVESQYGFHVIKITGKTTPTKKVRVAMVKRAMEASSKTMQDIYTQASQFASEAKDQETFDTLVKQKNLTKRVAERITVEQNSLPGLENAREVVRWSFDDKREIGDVSNVFDLEGRYIVAVLTQIREKGTPTLEQLKEFIEPLVKREKKAEKLIAQINGQIKSKTDLEKNYPALAMKVDTADITIGANSLPGFGKEDEVIGTVFTLKEGDMSKPVKGNQGVFMVIIDKVSKAAPKDDYTPEKKMLSSAFITRSQREINEALKKRADIEDHRLMFY
ncbi:MAG TPA: SurA N-terminal domain-containing protein [Lentimicrobium sp.]|nr:SurA N-terminal domain-containing protein [Lentimicrobium sp.]